MNVLAIHVKMVGHVPIMLMAIRAPVLVDILELTVKQVHFLTSHIDVIMSGFFIGLL